MNKDKKLIFIIATAFLITAGIVYFTLTQDIKLPKAPDQPTQTTQKPNQPVKPKEAQKDTTKPTEVEEPPGLPKTVKEGNKPKKAKESTPEVNIPEEELKGTLWTSAQFISIKNNKVVVLDAQGKEDIFYTDKAVGVTFEGLKKDSKIKLTYKLKGSKKHVQLMQYLGE